MLDTLVVFWPHFLWLLTILTTVLACTHAILSKRDAGSATAWAGLILFLPIFGALLYLMFGINRIRRRARALRSDSRKAPTTDSRPEQALEGVRSLQVLVARTTGRETLAGNRIGPLQNPELAYPAMIAAIEKATRTVSLCTYIFDLDADGKSFVDALARAVERGVLVRVLIDDIGAKYSYPPTIPALRSRGVPVSRFLPTFLPWRFPYFNLRNHRKILVVDGTVGFTGGMNLRTGPDSEHPTRGKIQDLHFQIEGPVVRHLQDTFVEDWEFSTGETLEGEPWFPPLTPKGDTLARGISDGPDEDFEQIRWTFLGAISCAQTSIDIVTPYFLPDSAMMSALSIAALRGIPVRIFLPEFNNLLFVQWACQANLPELIERGVQIFLTRPPFDHTKLMIVDGTWSLLGSANWDPRSYRLNFEFNVECYDAELAKELAKKVAGKLAKSRRLSLEEINRRGLLIRLRDGIARLFFPYL